MNKGLKVALELASKAGTEMMKITADGKVTLGEAAASTSKVVSTLLNGAGWMQKPLFKVTGKTVRVSNVFGFVVDCGKSAGKRFYLGGVKVG